VPLLIFGALVAGLTWWSRTARWLHVRVREEEQRINISLPLPLRPAAWALRLARPWVPQLKDTAVDELILSLAEADVEEEILIVEVDEGEGEQVEVRIG
jgi:CHASE2 domain-containing sensor protein